MILAHLVLVIACLLLAVASVPPGARGWRPPVRPSVPELSFAWAALLGALAVVSWLMVGPVMSSRSMTITADGRRDVIDRRLTLIESGDVAAITILVLVLVLAATPVICARRPLRYWLEMWGALTLATLSLLTGFSIGVFLLPIATFLFIAAMLGRASRVSET